MSIVAPSADSASKFASAGPPPGTTEQVSDTMLLRSVGESGMKNGSGWVVDQKALILGGGCGDATPCTPSLVCHNSVRPPDVTGENVCCQRAFAGGDSHSPQGTSSAEWSGSGAAGTPFAGLATTGTSCGFRFVQVSRPSIVSGMAACLGNSNASQLLPARAPCSGGNGKPVIEVLNSTDCSPMCCGWKMTTIRAGWVALSGTTNVWPPRTTRLQL